MLLNAILLLVSLVSMEGLGFLAHKYVMHGVGWFLHKSHHEPHLWLFETNDLYLLALALIAAGVGWFGRMLWPPLQWVGIGVAAYGAIYVVVHDGIVHRHWPFRLRPRHPYLRRLYHAHLLHHAVKGRRHSVSFGFLYAPPVSKLNAQRRRRREEG